MIDVHSHIIHGVDDGPSRIEQSIRMVAAAEKQGIKVIVATPHYHENIFENERIEENFRELLHRTGDYDVTIKMGYEVFINPFTLHSPKSKKHLTLASSKYILLEFSLNTTPGYCLESIKKLQLEDIVPVISHMERNANFHYNFGDLVSFIKVGCLIQVDVGSIIGNYGKRVKAFTKKLVQMNLVDLVASNAHYENDYAECYSKAHKTIIQWAGTEYAHNVFARNAERILEEVKTSVYKVV